MKRRGFFAAFGFGAAATVAGIAKATPPPVKRDIHWARKMCQEGHRVRLPSWCTPVAQRPSAPAGMVVFTIQMGDAAGVDSVDDLAVTPQMLEGPWEIVPPEDMPKPPEITFTTNGGTGGAVVLMSGTGSSGGDIILTSGNATNSTLFRV